MMAMEILQLSKSDVDAILSLEEVCFEPCLRASKETLISRFDLGHIMLGLYGDGMLVGVASFSYRWFSSKEETRRFAANEWRPFYQMKMTDLFNTVLVYNVELHPSYRGTEYIYYLLNSMMERAATDGCQYLIGISRMPSYNGDSTHRTAAKPMLKAAVDLYLDGGPFPSEKVLSQDPLLLLYKHIGNCEVLALIENYVPEDKPSGGKRAIVYTKLEGQWHQKRGK